MKLKFLFPACFLSILTGLDCSDTPRQTNPSPINAGDKPVKTKPSSSYSDTVEIDLPSAVFYNPDSIQLEKIKAVTEAGIFESTMHEFFYQMRNSRMVLKKYYPHIKILEVKNARYLLFKKMDAERELIDLNDKNDPFGLFLFDGRQAPRLVDMTNIESELGFYFSRKPAGRAF